MNLLLCTVGQESNPIFCLNQIGFPPTSLLLFKQGLFLSQCRSWRTCCLLDQSRPSSLETQRRSTCRTTTWARARHRAAAEKPTMTAQMTRVVTTGQGFSVPTSSHKIHTHTHTQQCTAWGEDVWGIEWKRMFVFFLMSERLGILQALVKWSCWFMARSISCVLGLLWSLSEEVAVGQPKTLHYTWNTFKTLNSKFRMMTDKYLRCMKTCGCLSVCKAI